MKAVWNRYGFVSVPLNPMIHMMIFPLQWNIYCFNTLTANAQGQKMNGKECQNLLMGAINAIVGWSFKWNIHWYFDISEF